MTEKDFAATPEKKIAKYVETVFKPEDPILAEVRQRSLTHGLPEIQVGSMDGLHLEVIARAMGAKKAVEIGTLGGYSAVHLLRGMGPEGKLYTFEYEPKHVEVARESFRRAGVAAQVEILVGAAVEQLPKISAKGPFDLVFIDADKENYPAYLKWAAENLRVGGVVLGDNTFGFGMIADEKIEDPEYEVMVRGIREFNRELAQSGRFRATILPTGEGLTMGVKIR